MRLAMSEAVLVTGRPYVVLDVGGVRHRAVYAGPIGSATDVLDFDYTVQAGDFDTDGVALCGRGAGCGRIALDGGSIRASYDGSVASLGHPALGAQSGHKADAAAALTLMPPTACANEIRVPDDWPLTPSGVSAGGKFRLLFVTSTARDATSSNIADYNRFVQNRAAAGHSSIRPYKDGFRAVGSTDAADARDNTCTTGTGVEIHWLNGNKVADDYADFYDDSWDDPNLKNEGGNGITGSSIQVFTGSGADGTAAADHYLGVASPNTAVMAIMPSTVRPLASHFGDVRGTRRFYGLSQVFKVPAASDRAHTTDIAIISSPAIGDAYRLGETVEVEVTYSEAVSVRGTPAVGLSVKNATGNDDNEYDAAYVRGSGTTKLVFAFTVPGGLKDDNGILLYSDPLRLNGARIATVSDGSSAAWTLAAWRNIGGKVDTSLPLSGGVCDRTPAVRYAIVAAVTAASDCSQVTEAHLAGMTGTLEFSGLTSIAAGDLAGLSSLTRLNLYGSGIETLPVGLFDGLGSLTRLDVRAGLTHLPKDIFRGLGKVTFLSLDGLEYPESPGNRLREGGLPDGIFEPLSREVKEFWIFGSPGSESFRPRAADAGPGGTLSAGQKVTLGGPGNDGGPWGSNVFYRWRQKDGSGNAVSTVALPVTDEVNVVANPSFTVPTLAETTEVRFQLQLDGAGKKLDGGAHGDARLRLGLYSPVSEARFTILALAPTAVAVVSKPVDGDTYRQGEKIEVAVTFGDRVLVDTSLGTPALGLAVGTETRQATYVRGTGSNRLVFEYTVQSGDTGSDGIAIAANGLAPGGGAIASVYGVRAILDHAALAAQTGHKVDGSLTHGFDLTGGVCGRTPQVRDKLLELVKANDPSVTDCSKVETTHLAALTEQLYLDHAGIATLKRGDFANLGGVAALTLNANDLTALTAGVFEGLGDTLTLLFLHRNALQSIAPGVFDGLTGPVLLKLDSNELSSLPPRIFEKLTGLTGLALGDNPGSARFAPIAKAGPAGGIEVVSGGNVTLGVEGAENGFDDPWGTNVTWAWSRTEGAGGMLADDTAARAAFTAPVTGEDKTYTFRLAVTGSDLYTTTADIAVRVAAGPKTVEAAFASEPAGGSAYAGSETIEVALHFDRAVTVDIAGGTPSVTLTVGAAPRTAGYLRGSDTRVLTFGYTVQAADMDADGVDLVANSLALNGGKIAAVSDGGLAALGHAALAGGSGRTVNSPTAGGICDRTAAVQTAILARVRADENDASLQCGDIGPVRLVAIGGRLDLSAQARNGRMTALRAGDFAWLANVTVLDLDNHALRSFPAGIFDPLTALSELSIAYNQTQAADRLTSLPAGLFDRLTKLTTLRLEHNDLETLPDGIFEKLTRLTTLTLHGNPGSAAFLPVAAAGPAGGLEAETGERVTLGGDAGGPWGGNVVHAWRQVSGTAVALSATDAAKPAFAAPALAGPEDLAFELTVTGRGTSLTATDRVSVRIAAAAAVSSVVPASTPIDGDTYRRGETIGIAVGFAKPVTVTGTPQLALSVGTNTRQAAYVRGSGTGQLVFEYTVVQADADSDGIAIAADSLAPGTGAIADATGMAALLGHPALAAQAAHRVDGSLTHAFNPMAGICGRTAPVRDGLLLAVRARTGDTALGCAQVTTTHLGALSGTLILAHKGIGTLKPGDFANLGGIAALQLDNNDLTSLPAGVFEGLDDTLTVLQLQGNNLSSLPARIFETLTSLTTLSLQGNPGLARFVPVARAGPAAGIEVAQGGSVTLGVEGAAAGYDDPWGANVTYSWSQSAGTAVTYDTGKGAATVRPSFTAPAEDETLTFTLTVTGRGAASSGSVNRHRGASTVSVRVGAAGVRPMPVGAAVNGATLTLTYGEDLQAIDPAAVPVSSRGPAYLPVVSEPGVRRNIETVGVSTARASGRTVIITLARTVVPNQVVTLSYFPDNATAASRVRDRVGNLAGAFAGLRVRNETSQPPVVGDIAFAGAAKTYRIGETVGIDVTFSEPVTVTGRPTLALEIGSANRKARWKAGQAAGAVQRFEYTVAEGEEDKDGIAVKADGLAVPSGSAIVTTAEREAVILGHGRVHDPAHKVDGVRPTVPQIGISPSHCNVSDANELWCATLTVERYEAGGSVFYGYLRSGGYGSVAPDTFTYRGVDVAVSALHKSIRSGTPLRFEVGPASGAAPAGGLLGAVSFSLEIGTGAGRKTLAIETPGTRTGFEFSGHNFEWNNGDRVPVKLVRRGAQATAASISSSPSRGSTYRAGETVTVRLAMSEAVLVTGRPYVVLDVGGVRHRAVYAGPIGSATDVLDFDYTVQAGDFDTDGVALCGRGAGCGRIALDGGSIRASYDGSVASLGHPALGAQSGHKADAAAALTLMPPTACANEIRVPDDWPLTPSGVSAGGKFRLLFVTSTARDATSSNIADYNRFVQNRAAAGHSSIRPYKDGFRAVGSTDAADARDNTCTTGTGVEIHWLNGNKVADDYADFYDDSWDDANLKNEGGNGITGSNIQVFTGSGADGTAAADHYLGVASPNTAVIAIMPTPVRPLAANLGDVRGTRRFYGLSQVFKVPAASDRAHTTDIAIISSPAIGDAYRLGETVEVEVTYSEAVSVRGTPAVGLSVKHAIENYDIEYNAAYVRGSGTTKLVFAFTVPGGLKDDNGILLYSNPLRLNGARIATVSDGSSAAWTLAAWRNIGGKVDTSLPLSGGVCDRTPAVRYAIVAAVTAASDCSQVTEAHLAGMTGTLEFSGLTSIAAGDLAGLSSLTRLNLYGSGIETLPVGLFDGLGSLTRLDVRAGLTHLPKDIFRGLGKVTFLSLDGLEYPESPGNRLREGGLPDGIFEPLSREVKEFWIFGSPGSESFRPRAADAGPGGTLSAGQKVTLGGPGNDGGPWGSNVFYRWRQKDGSGNAVSTVALPVTDEVNVVANPSFTVPTLAETTEVRFQLQLDGAGKKLDGGAHGDASLRLGLYSPVSEARFTILGLAPTAVAVVSKPVDGDTYRQGEKIEVAVTFGDRVLVDTSLGTPALGLAVGTETRQATYVRGTGSNRLVFEYTVQSGDTGSDGIAIAANGLAPGGGAIASVYGVRAILDHAALAAQTGHKVDGSLTHGFDLTGGVCGRTPQVRDKLLELVKANDPSVTDCSKVETTHLAALTEQLYLDHAGIATLKRGDFANLGGVAALTLNANDLTALTAGVFEGLGDTLTLLFLHRNALQSIAPGVFDGLTGPVLLQLDSNELSSLPPRIFEKLTGLTGLALGDNPGSARFAPIAKAGPAGGIEVVSGGNVTLGVEGAENGFDDPWGTNVTWAWSRTEGAGGMLADDTAARAAFTAPVTGEDKTYTFRLAVTGSDLYTTTADIAVRVAAGPKTVEAAFASEPAGGSAYAGSETIEVALRFDRAVNVDTTGGTPSVALTVGAGSRPAGYLRGSGTRALTFGYTVQAADVDADGVDLVANSLALNGGKIAAVSDGGLAALGHTALSGGSGRTVNVAGTPAARGICDRTAAVQTAILARVRADENDASLQCGDIGPVRLVAIGGRLDLSAQARNGRMTALRAGDFAWLANVTVLDLDNHALRSFPAGIFDPLTALSELSIAYNQTQAADRLTSLPAGLFDRLTKLTTLRLEHNDLETLPDGIFEKLTRLTTLTLHGNPGSAAFLPVAAAGPAGGLEAETGERVTLGGDAGGPWGGNVVHAWRQVSGTAVALSATDAAKPAFAAPALAGPEDLAFELTVTGRGTSLTATDRVSVRIAAAAAVSSVVPASTPIDGDTYRRGETIGIAVGFAKPVTVTGTPQLALSVGTNTRQAAYVRGSGTGQLVFEYTVVQADADSDGIAIAADSLAPGTGAIADATGMAALLGHPALAAQAAHRVDGSLTHAFNPMAGICGRTAPVRDALLLAVRARTGDTALGCAQVTTTHLGALSGTLILAHKGIGTLKPGDFANLGGIAALQLDNNDLQTIPAGVFDRLTGLTTLSLHDNRLPSLPDRIFEGLMKLTQLSLNGNPGTADFKPTAMAGPEGGIDVPQGATTGITLGVEVPENGYDDPWGTNVTYAWSRTEGTGGTLTDATAAQAVFTPPATDGTHAFRLTVTGGGGVAATSTVNVRVGATAMGPMPVSAVVDGETLTLTYDRDLQEINPASVPVLSKGPVYLAVLSAPGARRNIETAAPSAVEVTGRQVVLTLDPPADFGDTVRLSYYPDNAVAASRVRGLGGTLADAFTGLRVDNDTPEGNTVQSFAVTGPAKTYRIGDTIGIELTFAEAVTVTGAPTLALEIGAARRKAAYVGGSGSAVLTFEATEVALGEEDTDGIAVAANGLEVPAGSSILNTADREAAILGHGRVHDPAYKVDGVLPTATAAAADGLTVVVTWSEALDPASAGSDAGGFGVKIGTGNGPAVSAVAVSGPTTTLSLASAIADGTANVKLEYTPPRSGAKIRDAAGNDAAAIPRDDAIPVKLLRGNAAPTVATVIPDQTATAGTAFSYAFPDTTFSDADSDTLTYTATQADGTALPTWLSFTASTRTFSGTPQAADVGTVSVKVTASDSSASVSDTFAIVVSAVPGTTHCTSDTNELWCATLTVGTTSQSGFTYTGYAIADNTIPAFGSIAPNTFTYRTATISVDILEYEGNSVFFEIARSSGTTPADGLLGPDTFTLEVGTGGTKNSFAIVNPGTTIYFELPDPGLSWSVGDTVPVKLVRTNAAPTVATVIPDQTATAATAFSYAFPATTFSDADSDTLTYTATQADGTALPSWLSFSTSTRTFSGTPQAADVETVSVKVTASDSSASVSDTFDIVVSAAPSLGTTCNAPDLAGRTQIWTNTLNVGGPDVGDGYGLIPTLDNSGTFTDPSNLSISYEANPYVINTILVRADARLDVFFNTALPSALKAKLAFHVCDEQFAFTDAPYNAAGIYHRYRWTSTGLDWSSESTRTLYMSVLGTTNNAPTVAAVIPDQTATAGTAFSYAFPATTFSDADGDTLTYTATKADGTALPSWLSFSASTRTFSGTPQTADVATVSVKVTASDGSASVSDTFDIVVSVAGDNAPTVAAVIQDQTATAGTAFIYAFPATTFSDANGDTLTYNATQADGTALPSWLSFSASTRTFSGTPQAADVATVSVKVTASDGSAAVSDTFDIVVSVVSVAVLGAPLGVVVDAPSGAVGLMRARWQAPPNASGIQGYHVRYRTVGTVLGASFRKVRANARELLLRYLEPGANYEAQICTVGSGERRGPCSPWARLQLAARNTVPANDFTVSLELPDGSAKATVAWDGTLTYRIRVRGVYDSSVLEFATSTVGTVATRLGPPGGRVPEFDSYDNNSDSTFSGYRGFARKFIVWDSPSSGYWERTQTVWTPAGANNAHVLELIDKPERLFTNRLNRIGTPSSLCVEITDSSNNVTAACPTAPAVGSPCGSLADELWCAEMTVGSENNANSVTGFNVNFYGSLVPGKFNYGGPEYSIFEIRQDTVGRNLNFALRPVPSNSLVNTAGFHLHVGTRSYSFPADSTGPDTSFLVWTNIDDPGWSSIGDRVIVRLTGPPASANQVEGPTVEGAPAVSEAGADGHWTEGETVEVTLAFSEAVTVDTANGVPSVGLGLSGPAATRSAPYLRGSGTAELVFSYTLVAGDGDHTVMAVTPDSLALNGGAIRSVATSADAALGHNGALVSAGPPRAPEGPSARFEGVPANHDGSDAFTVELHFSAEPEGLSYRTVQDGLLKVDGGTVTRAARTTRGSNLGWRVTVAPSGTGDVQIQLPARPCGKPNAICIGNRPLRQAAQTTIPGIVVTVPLMPLTASFSGTPTEHDGTSPFELQLRLSEEPAGLSYRTVQSGLFDVSGGTIGRAWRLVRGNDTGWGFVSSPRASAT